MFAMARQTDALVKSDQQSRRARHGHNLRLASQSVQARGCACGGTCPRCKAQASAQSPLAVKPQEIQFKPALGMLDDPLEREADAVAARVMNGPTLLQRAAVSPVQTIAAPVRSASSLSGPVSRGIGAGGEPMRGETRQFMESRFGQDFGQVRIHRDVHAAASARELGALAYTVGNDIVFAAGRYAPESASGRNLLAHELTHTLQQGAASGAGLPVQGRAPLSVQRVGECSGKRKDRCSGSCVPNSGTGTGFCTWSGTIANGCICQPRDQPMLREAQQILFNMIIAALIVAGIVLTAAAVAAIVACLMGPCEVAGLAAAIGFGAAAIVMGIIGSGNKDEGA